VWQEGRQENAGNMQTEAPTRAGTLRERDGRGRPPSAGPRLVLGVEAAMRAGAVRAAAAPGALLCQLRVRLDLQAPALPQHALALGDRAALGSGASPTVQRGGGIQGCCVWWAPLQALPGRPQKTHSRPFSKANKGRRQSRACNLLCMRSAKARARPAARAAARLVLREVPVEARDLVERAHIQQLQDEGQREEVAAHVQQHAAPGKARRVYHLLRRPAGASSATAVPPWQGPDGHPSAVTSACTPRFRHGRRPAVPAMRPMTMHHACHPPCPCACRGACSRRASGAIPRRART